LIRSPASGEAGQLDWFFEWASKNQIFLNSLRLMAFARKQKRPTSLPVFLLFRI
jgi:hypothetical protein